MDSTTFTAAAASCEGTGARLCYAEELSLGEVSSAASSEVAWAANDDCDSATARATALSSSFTGDSSYDFPGTCDASTSSHEFGCCCDTEASTRRTPAESILVSDIVQNNCYDDGTLSSDIALLVLAENSAHTPADFIGKTGTSYSEPMVDEDVTVMGWGTLSSGGSSPDELRAVDVPVWSNTACDSLYATLYGPGQIDSTMLCAGFDDEAKDSCQGDSGGPLFVKEGADTDVIVGIVSWGYSCAANFPGVYTRVSEFSAFINSVVDGNVIQTCQVEEDDEVPSAWTCNPSYYNADDGCDCGCGQIDPDCLLDMSWKMDVWNCADDTSVCNPSGYCHAVGSTSKRARWKASARPPSFWVKSVDASAGTKVVGVRWPKAVRAVKYVVSVDGAQESLLGTDVFVDNKNTYVREIEMSCAESHELLLQAWNQKNYAATVYTLTIPAGCS